MSERELSASEIAAGDPDFKRWVDELTCCESVAVRAVVVAVQAAAFPMFALLGPERRLIYNEAYAPILGDKHPAALGRPFFDVWPEVRSKIEPVIDEAEQGHTALFHDFPVALYRPEPEIAWFTFSYSPVRDETGATSAILCICSETTEAVLARRRQEFLINLEQSFRAYDDPRDIVRTAQAKLGSYLGVGRVGYGSLDETERFFTTTDNWTDGSIPNHNGTHDLAAFGEEIFTALRQGVSLAVEDTATDSRAQLGDAAVTFAALQTRSAATVSLIKGGRFVAAMYVHHHQPRRWRQDDIALIEEVAERTWSAVERAHAQENLRALASRQALLLKLSDRLRLLADPEKIKEAAAQMLGEFLGVGRAGYGDIDDAQKHVSVARDWTNGEMSSLAGETRSLDVFGPRIIAELRSGHLLRLDSVADNPVSAAYAEGYASIGTKSLLIVPLIKDGRFVAILYLHEAEQRGWTDEDAALAAEVADRTWAAVERAKAEDAVRELNRTLEQRVSAALSERRVFAEIVQETDSPIQMIDPDYRFVAFNRAARAGYESVFHVTPEIGLSLLDLLRHVPEQRQNAKEAWDRALAGESFELRTWWGEETRDRRAYDMHFRPLLNGEGQIAGAYLIGRDVTDLLREQERLAAAEEQLRQAQKMEAMGQLTGGVAHDFNNLLTPIVGSLDMLQRKGLGNEREQRLIAGAAQSAERARVLVQRLLAFARRQPLQPVAVDVGELVHGLADLIASTAGPQIKIALDIAEDLPPAKADHNQLEMALLNLAVNARDAMPDGGMLRITVGASTSRSPAPGLTVGEYIHLSVADTGVGMDEETMARAVEPFFSTKGIGKGTGLGLSMAHGLASQLGGALTIQSRLGVGTNVELWLPISSSAVPERVVDPSGSAEASGAGVALVVDDEELVRLNTVEMLKDLGYDITEAASAEEALSQIQKGLRPDLLVTDHLMTGMSGTELARTVLEELPQTRVLIISGYADVEGIAPDLPRLSKPFLSADLAAAVAALR